MKKNNQPKGFIKVEGVSLNASNVSGMTREGWAKVANEAGYFTLVGNKTPTKEARQAVVDRAYDLAHEEMGTTAKPATVKTGLPTKEA